MFRKFSTYISSSLIICAMAGFLGSWIWAFDLISNFRPHLAGLLCGSMVLLLLEKRLRFFFASFITFCLNIYPIIVSESSSISEPNEPGTLTYKIISFNMNQDNHEYDPIVDYIKVSNPDFLIVLELNDGMKERLDRHSFVDSYFDLRTDLFGFGIYSKHRFAAKWKWHYGPRRIPVGVVTIANLNGNPLNIVATHMLPPVAKNLAAGRNNQLQELAKDLRSLAGDTVIAGDFNLTPWTKEFQQFLSQALLKDTRVGLGIFPTWPAQLKYFGIPIDHILVSQNLFVRERGLGPSFGSDHRLVYATFSPKTESPQSPNVRSNYSSPRASHHRSPDRRN